VFPRQLADFIRWPEMVVLGQANPVQSQGFGCMNELVSPHKAVIGKGVAVGMQVDQRCNPHPGLQWVPNHIDATHQLLRWVPYFYTDDSFRDHTLSSVRVLCVQCRTDVLDRQARTRTKAGKELLLGD